MSKHSIRKTYCEAQKQHMPHFMEVAMVRGILFLLHFRKITVKRESITAHNTINNSIELCASVVNSFPLLQLKM